MTRTGFIGMLEDLLGLPPGMLKESDTRETVEGWSSLTDVQILALISEQCGIEVNESLTDYENVGELLQILTELKAFDG